MLCRNSWTFSNGSYSTGRFGNAEDSVDDLELDSCDSSAFGSEAAGESSFED